MYVVVAGGGHMGTHLVSRLVAEGHDTVAIDINPDVTQRIFAEQGVVAVTGSATDVGVLDQSGIRRADAAIAMTGRDSDNLSFCLLARYYGVPRVLARMLNPQYEIPYRLVGATRVHSEADILVKSFLVSLDFPEISSLMGIGKSDLAVFEVPIAVGSPVAGQTVADIRRRDDFPKRCVFIGVELEDGEVETPQGGTTIRGGTSVILAAHRPDLPQLLRCLVEAGEGALNPTEQEAFQALRGVGFLAGAAREDLVGLASGARFESRKKGEVLYAVGQPGDRLYILRKGAVALERRGDSMVLRPPVWLGEVGAITGGPRRFTARVVEDAELLVIEGGVLRGMLLKNPFLALELNKALSERMAR
jgi:trk system potassium uptake protein